MGWHQFKDGILCLKQVTGRNQHEIECYIVAVIADGTKEEVVTAIQYLMEFHYLAQSPTPNSDMCQQMLESLKAFHMYKHAIMDEKGRINKAGAPMGHWEIPKLELFQSVVPNIMANGAAIQYTADITEHLHVTEIKKPAHSGNNQNYDTQIVHALD